MPDYVPNTVVKLLTNVPLDSTYTDTRWFTSLGAQQAFFNGKVHKTYTNLTYQRVNNSVAQPRGPLTCRVPEIADNLYNCNYMMFQNSNYGNKWFYAFITQVNYINPNNTEIVYRIDYLQTFMMEIKIKPSFVIREHASSAEDKPFANLTPEPLNVPNWVESTTEFFHWDLQQQTGDTAPDIVVAVIPNNLVESLLAGFSGVLFSGIYSGAKYKIYSTYQEVNSFIESMAAIGGADAIVDVFMTPHGPQVGSVPSTYDFTTTISRKNETFTTAQGTYTIRNKKLLNGQFTKIVGFSESGGSAEYLPENLYGGDTFKGVVTVCYGPEFSMMMRPNYMGPAESIGSIDHALTFSQNVHCTWNGNGNGIGSALNKAIRAGISAGAFTSAASAVGGVISGAPTSVIGGISSGGAAGAAASGAWPMGGAGPLVPASGGGALARSSGVFSGSPASQILDASFRVIEDNGSANSGGVAQMMKQIGSYMTAGGGRHATANGASDALTFAMGLHGFDFKRICPDIDTLQKFDTFFDMFGYAVNKVKQPNTQTRAAWNYLQLESPCIVGSVPVQGMNEIKAAFSRGIRLWHVDEVGDYSIENPPSVG